MTPVARMEHVQELARAGDWICSMTDLYGAGAPNGRNDLSTLELGYGWVFEEEWATHGYARHKHHRLVVEGRSTTEPRIPVQQRLLST